MTKIIDQYMYFWPALYLPSTGTSSPLAVHVPEHRAEPLGVARDEQVVSPEPRRVRVEHDRRARRRGTGAITRMNAASAEQRARPVEERVEEREPGQEERHVQDGHGPVREPLAVRVAGEEVGVGARRHLLERSHGARPPFSWPLSSTSSGPTFM